MKVTSKLLPQTFCGSFLMLAVGMLIPKTVSAQTAEQVMPLLQGYEWTLQPKRFQYLGKDIDLALMEIASDTTLMNAYRFRALQTLKLFEKERVADFLENYIEQNRSASHLRRAFESLSSGFATTQPERVQQAARKLLNNANPHVRISAARALKKLDTSNSRSAYRTYLSTEEEDWVRKAIEK